MGNPVNGNKDWGKTVNMGTSLLQLIMAPIIAVMLPMMISMQEKLGQVQGALSIIQTNAPYESLGERLDAHGRRMDRIENSVERMRDIRGDLGDDETTG